MRAFWQKFNRHPLLAKVVVKIMTEKAPQQKKTQPSASDIRMQRGGRYLPRAMHPYISLARLDRPIGWWLLLLPGWWIIAGYSPNLETAFFLMAIFMIGAIIMRAAGCVINDLWDRNIDKQVARTKDRPLASGEITPFRAVAFLVFLTVLGLGLLVQLPLRTWIVGASAAPLIILYPLAKRVFGFPQLVLGLTFSWGIPVAASILWAGMPPFGLFLVYAGTVFWVIGYDTIYAIQDMPDDRATGVKSSALTLGARLKAGVALFYGAATACWVLGFYSLSGPDIWLFGVLAAGVHLGRQALQIDIAAPDTALRLFISNRDTGLLVTAALLAQQII